MMSRKKFIESQGATCKNWRGSWSFVNHNEKVVIFGAWDINNNGNKSLIFSESWNTSEKGRKTAAFEQSREHIRLIEDEGYILKTFPIKHSYANKDENGIGPAKIKSFTPKLDRKYLKREGDKWYASDGEISIQNVEEVESNGNLQPILNVKQAPFEFHSGYTAKISSTTGSCPERQRDIVLRHNDLQKALYSQLANKYGEKNVGAEIDSGIGTSIDLVVRQEEKYWFYEIKTDNSLRVCIREAIGQLLEYAFWSDSKEVTRLIIVGEVKLDSECEQYLQTLRNRYSLPIEYEQFVL